MCQPCEPLPAAAPPAPANPGSLYGSRRQWLVFLGLPVVLVVVTWVAPAVIFTRCGRPEPTARDAGPPDGAALFAQNCAQCHGARGDGNGVAHLNPRARNFGEGKFRLATTANGVPTDADLPFVLRHGIPGSAMPAFDKLSEEGARAVIGQVRRLTRTGLFARLRRHAEQAGEVDAGELAEAVDRLTRPGSPLAVPDQL